jgi:hypothetical protein
VEEAPDEGSLSAERSVPVERTLTQASQLLTPELPSLARGEGASTGFVYGSLLAVALAQQILGEIGERRARQRGERQRPRHVDGGEAEAGGQ